MLTNNSPIKTNYTQSRIDDVTFLEENLTYHGEA